VLICCNIFQDGYPTNIPRYHCGRLRALGLVFLDAIASSISRLEHPWKATWNLKIAFSKRIQKEPPHLWVHFQVLHFGSVLHPPRHWLGGWYCHCTWGYLLIWGILSFVCKSPWLYQVELMVENWWFRFSLIIPKNNNSFVSVIREFQIINPQQISIGEL